MKRVLSVLCVLCLLVAMIPVIGVAAQTAQTYNFSQLDGHYKTQGRVEIVDGALNMDTSSSGFEFYFRGNGDVLMGADVWCTYTTNMFFTVIVDGVKSRVEVNTGTTSQSVYKSIALATGLPEGDHHIEVYKQTEASSALVTVWGVSFAGDPYAAPPSDKITIEVVGDSISGGASNLATNATQNASYPVYQDGTQTYAYLTGEALGANVRVTQTSGFGCCGGWNSQGTALNLQDMYPYTSYWRDHSAAGLYDFDPAADIVVINLGTNDFSAANYGKISLTNAQFKAGAKNLMTMARKKNPGAKIVWVTGMMGVTYKTELTAAVAELGGAENGYFFTVLPEGTSGGEGHPNVAQHKAAADTLTAFLLQNCLPADYKAKFADRATLLVTLNQAKAVATPCVALSTAITYAEMELACGTTDVYRLGVRKADLDAAMKQSGYTGFNLMPVEGVTTCPVTGNDDAVWPYYSDGMVTLYKAGDDNYWPYVHTEYDQVLNVNDTPYLTVDVSSTASWNIHIAYLDKDGVRQTVAVSTVAGHGAADYAANPTRTIHRIDFASYIRAQGHADANGCVTVVGCDIYVVGETDTFVHLSTCAFTAAATDISGAYAVTDGLLEPLTCGMTVAELLAVMDNAANLRVVDADGNDVSGALATDMVLQMFTDGKITDEAIIVVRADINGDAEISTLDVRAMLSATLGEATWSDAQFSAADLDQNGTMNTVDIRILLKELVA